MSSTNVFLSLDGEEGLLTQEDDSYLLVDKESECDPRFVNFETEFECGEQRFRRLRLLGYV